MADQSAVLPEEAVEALAAGRVEEAGERLRVHAEHLTRASPRTGRAWSDRAATTAFSDPLLAAYSRWARGVVHHMVGEAAAAERELTAASAAMRDCGRPDLEDRVRLLLIDVFAERLQLARARRMAARLERRFTDRGDRERAAAALANLACAEDTADRVDRASLLWRRALPRLRPGGLRHLLVRANLATVAALEGRFPAALEAQAKVRADAELLGFPAVALQAELNLAEAELALGRVDNALERWQRIIADSGGDSGLRLAAELDLAAAEHELGDAPRALARLERIAPELRAFGLDVEEGRCRRLLAVTRAAGGDMASWRAELTRLQGTPFATARALLLVDAAQLDPSCPPQQIVRAARTLDRSGLRRRAELALAWAARRYLDHGKIVQARRLARRVLDGRRASAWARLLAHHVLGRCGGDGATRHLHRAVAWADRLHGRMGAAADRSAFMALRGEVYLDLVNVLLERGRAADRRRALDLVSRLRSGWLLDELGRRSDRGDDPLVRHWQELRRQLASLLEHTEGADEPRLRRVAVPLAAELRRVAGELDQTEVSLARRWPGLSPALSGNPVARRLLDRLPPGDCCLELHLAGDDLLAFVALSGRLEVVRLAGVTPELERLVSSVRFHLDTRAWMGDDHAGVGARNLQTRARRLGELLLSALPDRGWDRLWLAPHGALYRLPWPAIALADGTPLIDRGVFSVIPDAAEVAALLEEAPERPERAAVTGAPVDSLPLVRRELGQLSRLLDTPECGRATTCREFLSLLESADLVHLAGHSVFLDGLPSASGLQLADGFVTVHDLAATRIRARVISFGVCSGARLADRDSHRSEGFLRALLAGGVRTVIGAIAPVRDEVAYAFDLELYRTLQASGDPGEAFRQAVGALRNDSADPAVWGNFQLYGDHRPWSMT